MNQKTCCEKAKFSSPCICEGVTFCPEHGFKHHVMEEPCKMCGKDFHPPGWSDEFCSESCVDQYGLLVEAYYGAFPPIKI